MSTIAFSPPYSPSIMDEAVAINQSFEKDARGLDLSFLGAPSENDSTPALEFPWTQLAKDVRLSPIQCLEDAAEEECIASTDVRPYVSTNYKLSSGFGHGNSPAKPPSLAQGRTAKQPAGEADTLSCNEAHDTTFSEPNPTSTRSTRRATSMSSTTPVDESGSPVIKQHRERNRVAARKSRQKAKRNEKELQRRERELSEQNKVLLSYVGSLRGDILDLKTEILRHSQCNSSIIQNYITNAARRQLG
ncbi:hypothetical protein F5B21DRAFT_490300 [Xylaria acuta]|nr:hypothetical protein F5B21DRAFT_490300 [Xylaria acuta]